jgi:hypothetical protein
LLRERVEPRRVLAVPGQDAFSRVEIHTGWNGTPPRGTDPSFEGGALTVMGS